jgi:hypothetical protein
MGVRDWTNIAKDRDAWKLALKEAEVPHGPYSQWGKGNGATEGGNGKNTHG